MNFAYPKSNVFPEEIIGLIGEDDIRLCKGLSNYQNLTNEQIIKKINVSEEIYWKKVLLFYLLNMIDFTGSEKVQGQEDSLDWKDNWNEAEFPAGVYVELAFVNSENANKPLLIQKNIFVPTGAWTAAGL